MNKKAILSLFNEAKKHFISHQPTLSSQYITYCKFNNLCGEQLTIHIKLNKELIIEDMILEGKICSFSTVSSFLIKKYILNKNIKEINNILYDIKKVALEEKEPIFMQEMIYFIDIKDKRRINCILLPYLLLIELIQKI